MDDRILEVLQTAGLVLSPSIIAYNLDVSREAVSRRLSDLAEHGLVNRKERGKYEISNLGNAYLQGDLDPEEIEKGS